jgi:hypothetical protein
MLDSTSNNLEQQAARALRVAQRVHAIEPFRVMEMVKAAGELKRAGVDVISMSVGEPDFTAPEMVASAAIEAIRAGVTQYTDALGLPALRESIAAHYARTYGLALDPRRVVVTAGASAGLLLACAALVAEGDEVLMPDPCYPCNRHFVTAFGGAPALVPSSAADRYQLTAEHIGQRWSARTRGVIVASPSNPTGTSMTVQQLQDMLAAVRARGGFQAPPRLPGAWPARTRIPGPGDTGRRVLRICRHRRGAARGARGQLGIEHGGAAASRRGDRPRRRLRLCRPGAACAVFVRDAVRADRGSGRADGADVRPLRRAANRRCTA